MTADETYHHEVAQWTVGQLRDALVGVPDDTPVCVSYAVEPGGSEADEQVVISAASRVQVWNALAQRWDELDRPATFEIETDFPTGDYTRSS